ncbi:MAG: hypothetical protein WC389_12770 [Lutibacter sp.]
MMRKNFKRQDLHLFYKNETGMDKVDLESLKTVLNTETINYIEWLEELASECILIKQELKTHYGI